MPTLAQTHQMRSLTQDYVTLGLQQITEMLRQVAGDDPNVVAGLLAELLPELVDPYAVAISDAATDFYLADRAAQGVAGRYLPPGGLGVPSRARFESLARWAASPLFQAAAHAAVPIVGGAVQDLVESDDPMGLVRDRVAGGVSGVLGKVQRDATLDLAALDPDETTTFQRVAMPGCCAFCAMLSTRGAAYSSQYAATHVVGRGVPVGKNLRADGRPRRGGQALGIESRSVRRGSSNARKLGDEYHDHCKCVAVAMHSGRAMEMDLAATTNMGAYAEADRRMREDLKQERHTGEDGRTQYHWEDAEGKRWKRDAYVLAQMRQILATN